MPTTYSQEDKKTLLQRDFYYEVTIFKKSYEGGLFLSAQTFEVALDSFLTHFRNLYEFFYDGGNSDKAHAFHFIESWRNKVPPSNIRIWNIKINQYLSHISYRRVTEIYSGWAVEEMYNHFINLINEFISELPSEFSNDELKRLNK